MDLMKIESSQIGKAAAQAVDVREMQEFFEKNVIAPLTYVDDLEKLSKLSFQDPKLVIEKLDIINCGGAFPFLKEMVRYHAIMAIHDMRNRERDIQDHFFENLQQFLPGSKKVCVKNHSLHIPDGFVEIDGCVYPVEVKLKEFTAASVRQLLRYMDFYGAKGGIAVAPKLRSPLPGNIQFIEVDIAK